MGKQALNALSACDWAQVKALERRSHFTGMVSISLIIGQRGVVHPAEFDESARLIMPLRGDVHVIVAPPHQWARMYPYPVSHPLDKCA